MNLNDNKTKDKDIFENLDEFLKRIIRLCK